MPAGVAQLGQRRWDEVPVSTSSQVRILPPHHSELHEFSGLNMLLIYMEMGSLAWHVRSFSCHGPRHHHARIARSDPISTTRWCHWIVRTTCSDGSVWISEIMPSDEGEGWVELQTSSWDTCNLDGWAISSGVAAEEKQFDANDTIVPSWRTNLSNQSDATLLGSQNSTVGDFHITFDVSVDGGMIALESPSGMFTNVSFPGWNAGDGSYHVCVDSTTNNPTWSWTGMENRSSTPDDLNDCPPPPCRAGQRSRSNGASQETPCGWSHLTWVQATSR